MLIFTRNPHSLLLFLLPHTHRSFSLLLILCPMTNFGQYLCVSGLPPSPPPSLYLFLALSFWTDGTHIHNLDLTVHTVYMEVSLPGGGYVTFIYRSFLNSAQHIQATTPSHPLSSFTSPRPPPLSLTSSPYLPLGKESLFSAPLKCFIKTHTQTHAFINVHIHMHKHVRVHSYHIWQGSLHAFNNQESKRKKII